jgi:hypothetical protein
MKYRYLYRFFTYLVR